MTAPQVDFVTQKDVGQIQNIFPKHVRFWDISGSIRSRTEFFQINPGKKLIITGGMYSSGTTWTFNILRKAALLQGSLVYGCYCENLNRSMLKKLQRYDALILKGHRLGKISAEMVSNGSAKLVVPIRDPRDAICSLMKRFGHSFSGALNAVSESADNILETQVKLPHLELRYEDGFTADVISVSKICTYLELSLCASQVALLHAELQPDQVKKLIAKMEETNIVNPYIPWRKFDRQTSWHINHVGDLKIGNYKHMLTRKQRDIADQRLGPFIKYFRYDQ